MKKNILVGITSGIALYKSIDLVNQLTKSGYNVKVVMTENATKLVSPTIFEALSKNRVYCEMFDRDLNVDVKHISLAQESDLYIIAPLTANTMAKIANGIADNLLTNIALAYDKKMILVPAMNTKMLENEFTQENLKKLSKKHIVMESDFGRLACGDLGRGKFPKVERIVEEIEDYFTKKDFLGKNVILTAGATVEEIDPVRYISNYSSGKMGNELALALKRRGANVKVICGKINETYEKFGIEYVRAITNEAMYREVEKNFDNCDIYISPSAPVDFKVKNRSAEKIKKSKSYSSIELEDNIDILKSISEKKSGQILVGFAAETENVIENARLKLKNKNLDMVVANDVSVSNIGFNSDNNKVYIITESECVETEVLSKFEIANIILDRILEKLCL